MKKLTAEQKETMITEMAETLFDNVVDRIFSENEIEQEFCENVGETFKHKKMDEDFSEQERNSIYDNLEEKGFKDLSWNDVEKVIEIFYELQEKYNQEIELD